MADMVDDNDTYEIWLAGLEDVRVLTVLCAQSFPMHEWGHVLLCEACLRGHWVFYCPQ